jgi:Sulfatase
LDLEASRERRDGIVAVAQTIESHHAIRAAGLFGVLAVAKILALSGRDLPLSAWAPFAFFWQDVLAALVFLALDGWLRRPVLAWLLYGASLLYIAVNVPVARVLGTPLTWNMMRAARGPLADSIWHHVTISNLCSLMLVTGVGVLLPLWLARKAVKPPASVLGAALFVVAAGVQADSHIETRGLQRNAFGALIGSRVTGLQKTTNEGGYLEVETRTTENGAGDLEHLRGAARGRHVVLIILESTAARYLGLYGARRDPMPALTDLGRRALVFESAYAVYPESIKGLFSTVCSRYPAFNASAEIHARVHCASIAQSLRGYGYRTALFHSGRFGYLGMAPMIEGRGFDLLEDAGAIGGQVHSSFGVDEPSTIRRMFAWIDSLKDSERFFLTYLPVAGHHPYSAPDHHGPFEGTSDFDRYLNSLHYGDAALRQLVDGLRARNLDERTLFVIQGDHGEAFGQHPDNVAHSLFVYDENIRVPYVIAAPGLIRDPIRVDRVTSTIDTAPTILDLLGYAPAPEHQGASLLNPAPRPAFFYTDYSLGWLGLRDSCWKYLYEIDSDRAKLFDLCSDPDEIRDRAGDFESRVLAYRARVRRWAAVQQTAVYREGRLTTRDREASLPR